jgi:putative ABC transport system ATP-binding protein
MVSSIRIGHSAEGHDPDGIAAMAEELVKVYGGGENAVRALDGVSVEFAAGRFTSIMGPSGSGKSTLLHCVAGLDAPTSGRVTIGTRALSGLSERELTRLRREQVGFVFQSFNLLPTLTALENVVLPLTLGGRAVDGAWLDVLVEAMGLRERLAHRPSELSGGEQQRVAAARALVTRPRIVFADEPTGNLDSRAGDELLAFMRRTVRELGQTIVMVTHNPVAASYSDRVLFLADGRIVDEVLEPTSERVLDELKRLGA